MHQHTKGLTDKEKYYIDKDLLELYNYISWYLSIPPDIDIFQYLYLPAKVPALAYF